MKIMRFDWSKMTPSEKKFVKEVIIKNHKEFLTLLRGYKIVIDNV